jgi:hypothetical protein
VFKLDRKMKTMVDKFTPAQMKEKIKIAKLETLIWLNFLSFACTLFGVINFIGKDDPMPMYMQAILNSLTLVCWICSLYSKFKNIKAMYLGIACIHIRMIVGIFQISRVLEKNDPAQEVYGSLLLFFGILLNQSFLGYLFERYRNHLNVLSCFILVFGWN